MTFDLSDLCAAFDGETCLAEGALRDIAPTVRQALLRSDARPVFFFHDRSGRSIDLDLRGSEADMLAQLDAQYGAKPAVPTSTGPGRPKLGVTAREITLLPRHWEWLTQQRGGASATLRRLVQEAIAKEENGPRQARDALYRIMSPLAGDRPGFEEASRALFAGDREKFEAHIARWPADIARSLRRLSARCFDDALPKGTASQ